MASIRSAATKETCPARKTTSVWRNLTAINHFAAQAARRLSIKTGCAIFPRPLNSLLKQMLIPPTAFWEWTGCITGVVGSIMLATRHPKSAWAFVLYLVSSCSWIIYGVMTKTPGLIAMQLVFVGTAVLGIYNWLIIPRRRDKPTSTS